MPNDLSYEQLEIVKLFFVTEVRKKEIVIGDAWRRIEGLQTDVNYFFYNSVEYHVFLSCRYQEHFGFGVFVCETMTPVIPNSTISLHEDYKTDLRNLLCKILI